MKYPHQRFLKYLLSRLAQDAEIEAECKLYDLVVPKPEDIRELSVLAGARPTFWRSTVTDANLPFRRWLKSQGIIEFWRGGPKVEQVRKFLASGGPRQAFEALVLAHGDVARARSECLLRFSEADLPSTDILNLYVNYFWDFTGFRPSEMNEYLALRGRDAAKLLQVARNKDTPTLMSMLGITEETVNFEKFTSTALGYIHQQLHLHMQQGIPQSGQDNAGLSALLRQAESLQRFQLEVSAAKSTDAQIREKIAAFKMRKQLEVAEIPSIDELRKIGVEETQEEEDGELILNEESGARDNVTAIRKVSF